MADFIPLTSGNKSWSRKGKINMRFEENKPRRSSGTPSEFHLLKKRIKVYLNADKGKKKFSTDNLVDYLREHYREYQRKKFNVYKKLVLKAYDQVCAEGSRNVQVEKPVPQDESGESSENDNKDESSDFSSENNYVIVEDTNAVNSSIRDLYTSNISTLENLEKNVTVDSSTPIKLKPTGHPIVDKTVSFSEKKIDVSGIESPNVIENKQLSQKRKSEGEKRKNSTKEEEKNKKKSTINSSKSTATFADIGGSDSCLEEVCKLLVHLKHPEVYKQLGVLPPRGLLLHGPPGCGKTLLAHAIGGELDLPFIKIAAPEMVSGVSGESEEKIRDVFKQAAASAPCILFFDEIDAITPRRDTAQREMERRIVAQLLTCMDDLNHNELAAQVLVIGATNRPDALDPALRRAGRFDREISLGIPNEASREKILKVLCKGLKLVLGFNFAGLALSTPGYVGADLMSLVREAAMNAVNRIFSACQQNTFAQEVMENTIPNNSSSSSTLNMYLSWLRDQPPLTSEQLEGLFVEMTDFQEALKVVQPSAKREGFATVPDTSWNDIGALNEVREELQMAILAPIRHPELYKDLGLENPAGILLCGPPGCGKTLLAKAIANESGVNFISVKGPELLNMYLGESERAVRQCFQRAHNSSPCVIFFDELDALCPKRSELSEGAAGSRVVNQLLTEMDGMQSRKNVFILAATNRPDIIDPAIMRPGRLDKILFVDLPTPNGRVDILKTITKNGTKPKLDTDIDLTILGYDNRCSGFTGADLTALVREAAVTTLKEFITLKDTPSNVSVGQRHFEIAFTKVHRSVSPREQRKYERLKASVLVMNCPSDGNSTCEPMQTESF